MDSIIRNAALEQIEKEIITLKNQTAENIILMGQKFIEAKKLVPHGTWGEWLESKVGFSQRTANQFMRIAQEYGSNSQAISNLEATKIYLLMELPVEDRDNFISQNDLKNMSTREVKNRLQEYKRNNMEIWKIVDKIPDLNIYDVHVDELKPLPNHEKYFGKIKGKNYVYFLDSIQKYGVVQPILITRDMTIISGHERVRACKDLEIETIPAHFFSSKNASNMKLDDLLLHTFFECNMHTRSSIFYLACAWDELYFGDTEKANYYMGKFINEGEQMDKEVDEWLEKKKAELQVMRANKVINAHGYREKFSD